MKKIEKLSNKEKLLKRLDEIEKRFKAEEKC